MKCNWAERWVVNNPFRVIEQRIEIKKLRRMSPLEPGFTALEIGCGRGAGAGIILDTFRPRLIYTTDLDVDMLDRARGYVRPEKMGRIRLVAADGSSLPFKTGSIDAIFGFGVLHHIPDWRRAVGEAARVLKAGELIFSKSSILPFTRISSRSHRRIRGKTASAAAISGMPLVRRTFPWPVR